MLSYKSSYIIIYNHIHYHIYCHALVHARQICGNLLECLKTHFKTPTKFTSQALKIEMGWDWVAEGMERDWGIGNIC